jgi:hypothetical protein
MRIGTRYTRRWRPYGRRVVSLLLLVMATIAQGVGTIGDLTSDDAARVLDAVDNEADELGGDDSGRLASEGDGLGVLALSVRPPAASMLSRAASTASASPALPFGLTVLRL